MNKRGISAIVATVLIILVTVAAVTIIWIVIIPMISEGTSFHDPNLRLNVQTSDGYTVYDPDLKFATIQIYRGADESDLLGIELIFGFEGNSVRHFVRNFPESNGMNVYYIDLGAFGVAPTSIGVAPVFSDGEIGSLLSEFDSEIPLADLSTFDSDLFEGPNGGYTGGRIDPNEPSVTTCLITGVSWSTTGPVIEGTSVSLNVFGNSFCDGESVSFMIRENDLFGRNDYPNIQPSLVVFVGGSATGTWTAEYQQDGLLGINDPPEYYFITTLVSDDSVSRSSGTADMLRVNKVVVPVCDGVAIEPPEVCDGNLLNGQTCVTLGFDYGTLDCASNCLSYDTSGCSNNPVTGAIIIDHTSVALFDDIPQYYIDEVKKMSLYYPGESHGSYIIIGMDLIDDGKYASNVMVSSTPEAYTDQYLRVLRDSRGEEDTWTNTAAISGLNNFLQTNDFDAFIFGWCWDTTWHNGVGGGIDPVYQVRWAGSTVGGPEGDLRWGLDLEDRALTGNSLSATNYTQSWDYYQQNNPNSWVVFSTGPAESGGELGYQRWLKHEFIRNWVRNSGDKVLFDYADILNYNEDNEVKLVTWIDSGGTLQTFPERHDDNELDLDGTYVEDGDHIGEVGAVRLAKAVWVLLAMRAGWDGIPVSCVSEICDDGVDNDCDGDVDCLDSDCFVAAVCQVPSCSEGLISSVCDCGGTSYGNGYCCSGVYQGGVCGLNTFSDSFIDSSNIFSNNGIIISGNAMLSGGLDYNSDVSLVSVYEFSDALNLGTDTKGNNNMDYVYGTPAQSSSFPVGFGGNSINLNGVSALSSEIVNTLDATANHTLCWWANPSSLGNSRNQFARASNYDTWPINTGLGYRWATSGGGWNYLDISNVYSANTWVHICNVYDRSILTKSVFINGGFRGSNILINNIVTSSSPWAIGAYCFSAINCGGRWQGLIYQPMWFNRVLSDGEINSVYSNTYFGNGGGTGDFISIVLSSGVKSVVEVTGVSWDETGVGGGNIIVVQVSANNGDNWYNVVNGGSLAQGSFVSGSQLRYRVTFNSVDSTLTMDNFNINWREV
jgi:hypothetical protein